MSWSPDLFIGELRPWPDTVHVVRGKTEEMRRYVPHRTCHNVHEPPKDATFWPTPHFKCSECGAKHISMDYVFYCPSCGAEVVE